MDNNELDYELYKLNNAIKILEKMKNEDFEDLYKTIFEIGQDFDHLRTIAPKVVGSVPVALLNQIDKGVTPDEYVKQLLLEVKECTERVQKKQEWLKYFKKSLDSFITANFSPEEIFQGQPDENVVQANHHY